MQVFQPGLRRLGAWLGVAGAARAMLVLALSLAQIDPQYATNLTLYREGAAAVEKLGLVNQDTGDLRGDAYFVLRGLMLPVECRSSDPSAHFDCDNPEQNSTSNIISQHIVTVDSRFGPYGSCNADKSGTYRCTCGSGFKQKPCGAPVGNVEVASREERHTVPPGSLDWKFWRVNLAIKIGGNWYSTHEAGQCSDGREAACTWRVLSTPRQIVAKCLETRIAEAIQAYNASCFSGCPQPHNASTTCVVDCYYSTLLGPTGGTGTISPSDGMPVGLIQAAWDKAFETADPAKGGCPDAYAPESARDPWPLSIVVEARCSGGAAWRR
tara:strand:+ start:244 stop:1218 length:975 start_codon:yes stop_codon:yes gene_type:complete